MKKYHKLSNDRNRCWFCKVVNPSPNTVCVCEAQITPTQEITPAQGTGRTETRDVVVESLQDNDVLVAIRVVGSDSHYAIMITDADGTTRSCEKRGGDDLRKNLTREEFQKAGEAILDSHAEDTTGPFWLPQ
ncbi:hypothetical protein OPT61_g7699 [Boeremia exigua]|uniref:Uncharacterized protein n=1 Tax=Boeremia exigua TaxID=749465 RepID=A0ACC2I279_9PLEO|nr:hypothetical protein OPT61_g7699 [Boeremia exigua]